jgi:MFS family permease
MRPAELMPVPRAARGRGQLLEGIRYVRGRPDLVMVMVVVFFVGTFGLNFQLTSALMATEVFGMGAGEYGLLGTVVAIGSLSGALLAARRGRPRIRLIVAAAVAFGLVEIIAGLMPSYWTFVATLIPLGLFQMTMLNSANATMQLAVDPAMRGRVMALYMAVLMGGTPIGSPLIGALAETFGARWSLIVGGAVSVAAALVAGALLARQRGMVLRDEIRVPVTSRFVPADERLDEAKETVQQA